MPRLRFTLRWLMVVVAIVGLVLGLATLWCRWRTYELKAEYHAGVARLLLGDLNQIEADNRYRVAGSRLAVPPSRHGEVLRQYGYHAELRRKYDRAARYPWLAIAPDPPEPE